MLLHRLAASTSSRVVGSVTHPSALIGSATASESFALGPPSGPSLGTDPWYQDSNASFYMTPHSAHLLHCVLLIAIALFIPPMVPLFLLLDRTHFVLTLFMSLMFLLFLI
jgi:hypothetical protein